MRSRLVLACAALSLIAYCGGAQPVSSQDKNTSPPEAPREFRAAWVATVANIDWPSKKGLSTEEQKDELLAILDKAAEMNLNAIVLQVRPATDAIYASKYEPWSEYLTGEMGKAPEPYYDPLKFAVEEAHKRGLELHAWFNPYRSLHPTAKGPISEKHLSKTHPEVVKKYGKHLWLDPGEKFVQDHSINVIMDVVKRYDVDGVHMDDYFYPYKEKGEDGEILDFPDEPSYKKYQETGGKLERDDWRRENVNQFVKRLYDEIKAEKPWVLFGLSPFGLGRPGKMPEQIKGFDQYEQLYADAQLWLNKGWIDYWTPQLYWPIAQTPQSYPVLLNWWAEQNTENRHLWPGNFTSKLGEGWPVEEIVYQIKVTRGIKGASGNVHFSMKPFMKNTKDIVDVLLADVYAQKALVPASTWLDDTKPPQPKAKAVKDASDEVVISWTAPSEEDIAKWVLYKKVDGKWDLQVLPVDTRSWTAEDPESLQAVAVSALDRVNNESTRTLVMLPGAEAAESE